jgi:hypothetical protein
MAKIDLHLRLDEGLAKALSQLAKRAARVNLVEGRLQLAADNAEAYRMGQALRVLQDALQGAGLDPR